MNQIIDFIIKRDDLNEKTKSKHYYELDKLKEELSELRSKRVIQMFLYIEIIFVFIRIVFANYYIQTFFDDIQDKYISEKILEPKMLCFIFYYSLFILGMLLLPHN